MPEISQAWLALIGAILGGSGLKFVEYYLGRPKQQEDVASSLRGELRTDLTRLRENLKNAQSDADKYRDLYWKEVEENAQLKAHQSLVEHKAEKVQEVAHELELPD